MKASLASARSARSVCSTSRSERERVRTNTFDLSKARDTHKFLRPLETVPAQERVHTQMARSRDPRPQGTCTNPGGTVKTSRIRVAAPGRGAAGRALIRPQPRQGIPLTVRAWNPIETERTFVTENMEAFRGHRENPNRYDRRREQLFQLTQSEKTWKTNNTAGVKGEPGRDCCDSLTLQAALKQANRNTLYRK